MHSVCTRMKRPASGHSECTRCVCVCKDNLWELVLAFHLVFLGGQVGQQVLFPAEPSGGPSAILCMHVIYLETRPPHPILAVFAISKGCMANIGPRIIVLRSILEEKECRSLVVDLGSLLAFYHKNEGSKF